MGFDPVSIAIVSAVVSGAMQFKAGKDAKKAAGRAADAEREEAAESRRRTEISQQGELSKSRAAAGASGLRLSGSQAQYIDELSQNYQKELDWTTKAGESRARVTEAKGQSAAYSSYAGAFSSLGSAAGKANKAGWFD